MPKESQGGVIGSPVYGGVVEDTFTFKNVAVKLKLISDEIQWFPLGKSRACFGLCSVGEGRVLLADVIGVSAFDAPQHAILELRSYRRDGRQYQKLRTVVLRFSHKESSVVQRWRSGIEDSLLKLSERPRRVLVFVNPYGGRRQAPFVWKLIAQPIFDTANVKYEVVSTERAGHAEEVLRGLSEDELSNFDGAVAVGGDGLFHELVNGLLHLRSAGDSRIQQLAGGLRLGHIPAGSTDTVAYTLNGTRDATTAALRVVQGDRTALDIARVDMMGSKRHQFAVSMIAYGYMGDLMKESELWRWMGPLRYEYVGAKVLFRSRLYRTKISFVPASDWESPSRHEQHSKQNVCVARCHRCMDAGRAKKGALAFSQPSRRVSLLSGEDWESLGWQQVEDEFRALMIVVIPCRSDKSIHGFLPASHLADGVVHLVLVRRCSNANYLRFLLHVNSQGLQDDMFDFVTIIPCTAIEVKPQGAESSWNCDGEILPENHIGVRAIQGLIQVFGRGVEVPHPHMAALNEGSATSEPVTVTDNGQEVEITPRRSHMYDEQATGYVPPDLQLQACASTTSESPMLAQGTPSSADV